MRTPVHNSEALRLLARLKYRMEGFVLQISHSPTGSSLCLPPRSADSLTISRWLDELDKIEAELKKD
jgi:hypothetical protein